MKIENGTFLNKMFDEEKAMFDASITRHNPDGVLCRKEEVYFSITEDTYFMCTEYADEHILVRKITDDEYVHWLKTHFADKMTK